MLQNVLKGASRVVARPPAGLISAVSRGVASMGFGGVTPTAPSTPLNSALDSIARFSSNLFVVEQRNSGISSDIKKQIEQIRFAHQSSKRPNQIADITLSELEELKKSAEAALKDIYGVLEAFDVTKKKIEKLSKGDSGVSNISLEIEGVSKILNGSGIDGLYDELITAEAEIQKMIKEVDAVKAERGYGEAVIGKVNEAVYKTAESAKEKGERFKEEGSKAWKRFKEAVKSSTKSSMKLGLKLAILNIIIAEVMLEVDIQEKAQEHSSKVEEGYENIAKEFYEMNKEVLNELMDEYIAELKPAERKFFNEIVKESIKDLKEMSDNDVAVLMKNGNYDKARLKECVNKTANTILTSNHKVLTATAIVFASVAGHVSGKPSKEVLNLAEQGKFDEMTGLEKFQMLAAACAVVATKPGSLPKGVSTSALHLVKEFDMIMACGLRMALLDYNKDLFMGGNDRIERN